MSYLRQSHTSPHRTERIILDIHSYGTTHTWPHLTYRLSAIPTSISERTFNPMRMYDVGGVTKQHSVVLQSLWCFKVFCVTKATVCGVTKATVCGVTKATVCGVTVTAEHIRNKTHVKYSACPHQESTASQLRLISAENPSLPYDDDHWPVCAVAQKNPMRAVP